MFNITSFSLRFVLNKFGRLPVFELYGNILMKNKTPWPVIISIFHFIFLSWLNYHLCCHSYNTGSPVKVAGTRWRCPSWSTLTVQTFTMTYEPPFWTSPPTRRSGLRCRWWTDTTRDPPVIPSTSKPPREVSVQYITSLWDFFHDLS